MKEYEEDYDKPLINYRMVAIIGIVLILFGVVYYPILFKKPVEKLPVIKNESKAIQIEYVYVTVTPTPDGKLYYASEFENGTRLLKHEFSITRTNTTGYKTTVLHANIYDYRIMNSYHWFNPTEYKYYEEYPSSLDKKFLFVFAYIYMDDVTGDDTRFWTPQVKQHAVQCKNKLYEPIDFMPQLRIKEFEDVYNSNDDSRIGYYNSIRMYKNTKDTIKTAGEYSESIDVLKAGKSNKIDGYIVFEIDKEDNPEDILVHVNYYGLGDSSWRLKPIQQ